MTTEYSILTKQEARRQIKVMRQAARKITSTPKRAKAFLISAGILSKNGKQLAPKYR